MMMVIARVIQDKVMTRYAEETTRIQSMVTKDVIHYTVKEMMIQFILEMIMITHPILVQVHPTI